MESVSFVTEIQKMMHACGDARTPLRESASLVESITRDCVTRACSEASKLSKGDDLVEAVLFLMRGDKHAMKHVLRTVSYRKLARQMQRSLSEEDPLIGCGAAGGQKVSINLSFLDPISSDYRLDFHSLLEGGDSMDSVTRQRYERYESLTRSMDTQQYLEFTECRSVNFTRKPNRFREWLGLSEDRASPRLLELLGYLCYEAVRRLVELALKCREQQQTLSQIFDPVSAMPLPLSGIQEPPRMLKRPAPVDPSFPPLVSTSPLSTLRSPSKRPRVHPSLTFHPLHPPLLPSHLREAHRRATLQPTQFFLFSSFSSQPSAPLRRARSLLF